MAAGAPADKAQAGSTPQFASLYVGDLQQDVTEAMLYEVFNAVGPVGSIRVCRDSVTRRSLGYGYVNYHNVKDAERAIDTLNYSKIKDRACRIMWSQRDSNLRKGGSGNIYVKNLDTEIDNKGLYDAFSLFGNILSCKVSCNSNGKSNGYGFVHFETDEAAAEAISKCNGMKIGNTEVEVTLFIKRDERESTTEKTFTNLYVKHFPNDWDGDKIKEVFGKYGTITSQLVQSDDKGRKFAFVNFETNEAAAKAIDELHGKDAPGTSDGEETFYVQRALSKKERWYQLNQQRKGTGGDDDLAGVNLFVKNLDESFDDDALRALFAPFGEITSCSAMRDENDKCKGFGFVSYTSADDATKAVTEMHLKVEKGRPLYVGLAEKKEVRAERLRNKFEKGKGKGKGGGGGGPAPQLIMNPMMMMMGKGGPGGPMMPGKGGPMSMMGGPMPMMGKGGPMPMMGKGGPMPMMPMMPMMGKGMPMNPMMMGKGGMPPMMMMGKGAPGMPGARPPMQQAPPLDQPGDAPLNAAALAAAAPAVQKQMLGEKLYPAVAKINQEFAGKITGMMLEMDNSELLMLLESEHQLKSKVAEAVAVLQK